MIVYITTTLSSLMQSEKQDTGTSRVNTKDQFYTNETVAKACIENILRLLPSTRNFLWIEPSAGNGSFFHNIPPSFDKLGFDIDPKGKGILKQNYLTWSPPHPQKNTIVFGNPPFGRQSSLAKAFISKSCQFAKVIAFILPKSFVKPSMFNAFDCKFHLLHSTELGKDSFVINGSKYDVPCVFQIWEKRDMPRQVEEKVSPYRFEYVKATEGYTLTFRRVGALAGKCYRKNCANYSSQSHYFLKLHDSITPHLEVLIEKINNHTFPSNTVGPRSISKSEANSVINEIIRTLPSS